MRYLFIIVLLVLQPIQACNYLTEQKATHKINKVKKHANRIESINFYTTTDVNGEVVVSGKYKDPSHRPTTTYFDRFDREILAEGLDTWITHYYTKNGTKRVKRECYGFGRFVTETEEYIYNKKGVLSEVNCRKQGKLSWCKYYNNDGHIIRRTEGNIETFYSKLPNVNNDDSESWEYRKIDHDGVYLVDGTFGLIKKGLKVTKGGKPTYKEKYVYSCGELQYKKTESFFYNDNGEVSKMIVAEIGSPIIAIPPGIIEGSTEYTKLIKHSYTPRPINTYYYKYDSHGRCIYEKIEQTKSKTYIELEQMLGHSDGESPVITRDYSYNKDDQWTKCIEKYCYEKNGVLTEPYRTLVIIRELTTKHRQ